MSDSKARTTPRRTDYRRFVALDTRWSDNDIYGHVNNVQYYSYFDTAVNRMLIEAGLLDIHQGSTIAFVVESSCAYFRPVACPAALEVGIRVAHLGRSSVRYELAIFEASRNTGAAAGSTASDTASDTACAAGVFVHVYVDRETSRPVAIPAATRQLFETLVIDAGRAA